MKILANENFPGTSIRKLRESGFDVESIKEVMPGSSDVDVLKRASERKQVIFTFDKDYGELIFYRKIAAPEGLIYFKFDPLTPSEPFELLMDVVIRNNLEVPGWFMVLEREAIRKKRLL